MMRGAQSNLRDIMIPPVGGLIVYGGGKPSAQRMANCRIQSAAPARAA